jgi:threonine dehydrogenase-like Zn-dependent dehydrogenase
LLGIKLCWKPQITSGDFLLARLLPLERSVISKLLYNTLSDFPKIPPCKVLVIGAGVAGLSAIATVSLHPETIVRDY